MPTEDDLNDFVLHLSYFISIAWYLKPNAFQIGEFWFFDREKRTLRRFAVGTMISPLISMKNSTIFLINGEVDKCLELLDRFIQFDFKAKFDLKDGTSDNSKLSILQRSAQLVEFSKLAEGPYQKIGLLCSALECLFTTDSSEVSHKVAERVAFFIAKTSKDRVEVYKTIKRAYTLRSNFFHGNKLRNIEDNEYYEIENLIRKVMNKAIFQTPKYFLESKTLEEYFINLVFNNHPTPVNPK